MAAGAAVRRLASMPVRRLPHLPLLPVAWALSDQLRVADAFYVACAQRVSGALLTCDVRLAAAAVPGLSVIVVR